MAIVSVGSHRARASGLFDQVVGLKVAEPVFDDAEIIGG